jgi:hypothetical protein
MLGVLPCDLCGCYEELLWRHTTDAKRDKV